MIRITQQKSAAGAKRYYATADYYSEGKEIIGMWGGKGASLLGLQGTVDKFSFERLCDNLHPKTGKQLTVRTRSERTVGYDITFSVPKSVSLAFALSGDQSILEAFRSAVNETMVVDIEPESKTRLRKGGQDTDRTVGNLVWAEYVHTTSRPISGIPDPQLHSHIFCLNSVWYEKERCWKAGQFRELKRDAPYFQAAFRVRLANKLQDLGFTIERKRDDFEIAGIPADVLKRFSRRTALIEKEAEKRGITDPKRKAQLGAETRERKGSAQGWESLRKEWNARLTDREREMLTAVHRRDRVVARPERGEAGAVNYAVEHSFVREAVVPERKLVTEALKRGLGAVTVEGVQQEMRRRPLIRSEKDGRPMATTKEMLALESRLIDFARQGRGRCRPFGDPQRPCSRSWFNEGQKAAVRHVLSSRDKILIVRGVAGTGKTTLEQEIGEALAEAGVPVVAIAQSVKASREVLREAGFANADTVARFLIDEKMQNTATGGVLIIDEASQLGTRDMNLIFDVAQNVNARVLLVGDRRQTRSVTAGEPLKLLEDMAGLKVAEVSEILRQQGNYKKAAKALSENRSADGFEELDKLGWIKEVGDADRYQVIADAYLAATSEKKRNGENKSALIIAPTHAEIDKISDAVRARLKEQGKLRKERIFTAWVPTHLTDAEKADPTQYDDGCMLEFHQNARGGYAKGSRLMVGEGIALPIDLAKRFEVYRPVQLALAVGDRILVTAGGKSKDGEHRLSNGSLFTIEGFTRRGDIVINHDWVIDRNWGHITRGYAITSHASQGVTVDEAIVGISSQSLPATTQRTAYVAVTRGKSRVQIFTDDSKELLKAFGRTDDPLSATEISRDMQPQPHVRDWMKEQQLALSAAALAGNTQQQPRVRDWMKKQQESVQSPALSGQRRDFMQPGVPRGGMAERGMDNAR